MNYIKYLWLCIGILGIEISTQAQIPPVRGPYPIISNAQPIGLDTVQVCRGDSITFQSSALNAPVSLINITSYSWNFNGATPINPGNVSSYTVTNWGAPGLYPIVHVVTRSFPPLTITSPSDPDTLWILVVDRPSVQPALDVSVCVGQGVALEPQRLVSTDSITWLPHPTLSYSRQDSVWVEPLMTTIYQYKAYTRVAYNGIERGFCRRFFNTTVSILPSPIVRAKRDTIICIGDSALLDVRPPLPPFPVNPVAYVWSTDRNFTTTLTTSRSYVVANLATTTRFYVRMTDGNGCTGVDSMTVVVRPRPATPTASVLDDSVCIGSTIALRGRDTSLATFWSGPNGFVAPLGRFDVPAFATLQTGYYTLTNRDTFSCPSLPDSVFVAVFQPPVTPPITGATPICEGVPLVLSAVPDTGSYLYWRAPNGDSLGGNSLMILSDSIHYQSGIWTLFSRNNAGCESRRDTVITIQPAPILPSPLRSISICAGELVQLNAPSLPNVVSYIWKDSIGAFVASGQNPILYSITHDTLLFLEVETVLGCRYILDSVAIQVNNRGAAPNIYVDSMACIGERNAIFSTDTAAGYYWRKDGQPISYQSSFFIDTVRRVDSGRYVLSVIGANGCLSDSNTVNFVVNRRPAIPSLDTLGLICRGDRYQLSGSAVGGLTAIWRNMNGDTLNGFSVWVSPDSSYYGAGLWRMVVRDSLTSCRRRSEDLQVQLQNRPIITVRNSGPICQGQTAVLTATDSTASGGLLSYVWYRDASLIDTIGTGPTLTVNTIQSDSTFYVVARNGAGCLSLVGSTTVLLANRSLSPTVPDSLVVCEGTDLTLSPVAPAQNYQWTGPLGYNSNLRTPTLDSIQLNQAGNYFLTVVQAVGDCPSIPAVVQVIVTPAPVQPIVTIPPFLCSNQSLVLTTTNSSHCSQLNWIGPNTINFPLLPGGVVSPGDPNHVSGFWSVECTDGLTGCVSRSAPSFIIIIPTPTLPTVAFVDSICVGDSVTLSVNSTINTGDVFRWYADSTQSVLIDTGASISIGPIINNQTYYLTVTNTAGCTAAQIPVSVNVYTTTTAPDIIGDSVYCEDEPIVLFTSATGTAYDWTSTTGWSSTDSLGIVTNQANSSHSGTYTLRVKDNNGCWSPTTSWPLQVNNNPIPPVASSNSPLCDGTPLVLSTTASCDSLEWYGPSGLSNDSILPIDTDYLDGSQWYVTCIDTTTGCFSLSNFVTLTIRESPFIDTFNISLPNCVGDTLGGIAQAFIASGGPLQYNWYSDSSRTTLLGGTDRLFIRSVFQDFPLYLVVTDTITGCEDAVTIPITVNQPSPTPIITGNLNYCEGELLSLSTAAIANQYSWTGPNGFVSVVPQLQRLLTPLDSGTYYLSVADSSGCFSSAASVVVAVNPLPDSFVVYTGGDVCVGQDATLFVGGSNAGTNYDWYQLPSNQYVGSGTSLTIPNVQASDSAYYYAVAVRNGCDLIGDSILLAVYAPSVRAVAGMDQLLCGEDTTRLLAQPIPSTVTGRWTSSSAVAIQQPTALNTAVGPLPVGRHIFYWTLSNTTCRNFAVDSVVIEVFPPTSEQAMAGADQQHCGNSFLNLAATAPQIGTGCWVQSNIQSNAGVIIIDSLNPATGLAGLQPGQAYQFIWELKNGRCGVYSRDTMQLVIDSLPMTRALAGVDQNNCFGDSVILQAVAAPTGQTGSWTSWNGGSLLSPNQATSIVTNLPVGDHAFVWTLSTNVCSDYSSDTVVITVVAPQPIAEADYFVLPNVNSTIDVISNDALPNSWTIRLQQTINQGQLTNLNTGEFTVTLSGVTAPQSFIYELCDVVCPNSCDTALVVLSVEQLIDCPIPNIFTPNNDGVNDQFEVPCVSEQNPAYLVVYNRWGDEVYQSDNYTNQWDGTHVGAALPDGTYFYVLQLINGTKTQGSVEIRR